MSDDYDEVFGEFGIDEADIIVIDDAAPPRRLVQMTLDGRRLPDEAPSSQRPRTVDASSINEIAVHNYTVTRVRDRQEPATHHKLDQTAIQSWVFPTNFAQRDYQYNMIYKALFANVLVALPTGLGKTFIAAVVMVNWYRCMH
jgi:ATP-dependent DNA helicase MPH1